MQILRLAETGIELEVPDNFHFHDDGQVRSLGAHTIKLRQRYGHSKLPKIVENCCVAALETFEPTYMKIAEQTGILKRLGGGNYCFHGCKYKTVEDAIEKGEEVNNHIYVVDGLTPIITSMIKGHEETHTLIYLNRLDKLKDALGRINVDACSLDELPLEAICHVGGFYAMVTKNPGEKQYKFWGSPYNQMMYEWLGKHSNWVGSGK
jgi:hypothetical protein